MGIKKITNASGNLLCIRCGLEGETRAAHYNGPRQMAFGKGRGIKCHDTATADLCHKCDQRFTEGSTSGDWANKWERSEEFLYWIMLSNIRRFKTGVLLV